MIYIKKYLYLIGVAIMIFVNIKCQNTNNNAVQSDSQTSSKENYLKSNSIATLDSITMIYTNYSYGISMDFPDNWTINRGRDQNTIIIGGEDDSSIYFIIYVNELQINNEKFTIWDTWNDDSTKFEKTLINSYIHSSGTDVHNHQIRKVYVSNKEALEMKLVFLHKDVDTEYEEQVILYSFIRLPFYFTVSINVPKIFYDLNPNRYYDMINNLVLFKPLNKAMQ